MTDDVPCPDTLDGLRDAILAHPRVRVVGTGSRLSWCTDWDGPCVSTRKLSGIVELRPDDFVAVAWSGTPVAELLDELAPRGLTLPLATGLPPVLTQRYGTLGGLFSCGLPHSLEGCHGTIRDQVLGIQVVRGSGEVAKAGSAVLKSVAGFDIQRFAVGARGGLFAISQVTMRLAPLAAIQPSPVEIRANAIANWVARLPRSQAPNFAESTAGAVAIDPTTGTVWASESLTNPNGWFMGPRGARSSNGLQALERSAKESFDPDGRFIGGWGA